MATQNLHVNVYRTYIRNCQQLKANGGFPGGSVLKNSPANTGDTASVLGSGRCPGVGKGNLLQYLHLENPMYREAWQAAVHGVKELGVTEQLSMQEQKQGRYSSVGE